MAAFLSTFQNRIDSKGRVSVPAPFRQVLDKQDSACIILYPSLKHECLEGSGDERMSEIVQAIDKLDAFSDEREDVETILADARQFNIDTDGRIVLPSEFLDYANLENTAIFAGRGKSFQIWEPNAYSAHRKERRARALKRGATLRIVGSGEESAT